MLPMQGLSGNRKDEDRQKTHDDPYHHDLHRRDQGACCLVKQKGQAPGQGKEAKDDIGVILHGRIFRGDDAVIVGPARISYKS